MENTRLNITNEGCIIDIINNVAEKSSIPDFKAKVECRNSSINFKDDDTLIADTKMYLTNIIKNGHKFKCLITPKNGLQQYKRLH